MGVWNTQFGGALFLNIKPPDFTDRYDAHNTELRQVVSPGGNNIGEYVFALDDTISSRRLVSWDRISDLDDIVDTHQLILYKPTETPFGTHFGLWTRASGSGGSETGYWCHARQSPNAELTISRLTGGSRVTVVDNLDVFGGGADYLINTWYWLEWLVIGTSHKARVWPFGGEVPNWILEATDGTHTAAGFTGFGGQNTQRIEVDWYSVGTEGDAPDFGPAEAVAPSRQNQLVAYPIKVQTDATSFLIYTGEPNVAVEWSLTGDGTLTVLTDQTDAAGKAWARYTPGTVGAHNVDVEVGVPV